MQAKLTGLLFTLLLSIQVNAQSDTLTFRSYLVIDTTFIEYNDVRELSTTYMLKIVPASDWNFCWCLKSCIDEKNKKPKYLRIGYSPKYQDSTNKIQLGILVPLKNERFQVQALLQSDLSNEIDVSFGIKELRLNYWHLGILKVPFLKIGMDLGYAYRNVGSVYLYPNIDIVLPNGRWNIEAGIKGYTKAEFGSKGILSLGLYGLFGL